MNWKQWAWLFAVQSIWAVSYVAMKVAGAAMPVGSVLFLRYGIAVLAYALLFIRLGVPKFRLRDLSLIGVVGVLNFGIAPALQVTSVRFTQAMDVSILISFEPMLTVLIAALLLRESISRATWVTLLVATGGLAILSGLGAGPLGEAEHRLFGNVLFLSSLLCEATTSVVGKPVTERYRASASTGLMMTAGFVAGSIFNYSEIRQTDFSSLALNVWVAVLFMGLACSVFAYTVWYRVIRTAPVNQVALSLFFQPIVGSIAGFIFLHETISLQSLTGSALVVTSLLWWQIRGSSSKMI